MPRPRRPLNEPNAAPRENEAELRVNRRIRVPRVLVIDESGGRLGEFLTEDAIRLAQERGLDLIEVSPNARPPVCRIGDYGRLKYEKQKKDKIARRNQVLVELKEVKLRPKTDEHDMDFKIRHARRFLEEGNKVKVTVRFRGREMAHQKLGEAQCIEFAEACKELGVIETTPRMEGRQMFMILAPLKKKQPKPQRDLRAERPHDDAAPPEADDPTGEIDDEDDDDLDDQDDDDSVE